MSYDEPQIDDREERIARRFFWVYFLVLPLLGLGVAILIWWMSRGASPSTTKTASGLNRIEESGLDAARQGLSRQTDLNACRSALQQINNELSEKAALRPPALTNEEKDWLRENLRLDREELSEVESNHYTRLDQQYLFDCFLMRDAAASAIVAKGVRGKNGGPAVRAKPLDQAVQVFALAMREVRLRPHEGEPDPPSFVARRGWGSALERALIFLALLEQLGDPSAPQPELLGFLLQAPDKAGALRLWACGVVVGDEKAVYLFDPYLGLPLPGPKGEGIATLAQVQEQAETLAQLNVDKKHRYPVTKEQARAAQAQLVCPLSALSPRMRLLQDKILAPAVRVRLASDAAKELKRIQTACSAGAQATSVQISKDKCTLLRRFMPVEQGGADTTSREQRFQFALVPWKVLPEVFQDDRLFPRKTALGMRVLSQLAGPFVTPTMEAGQPRDLLLRGRYSSAVQKLLVERDGWRSVLAQRANIGDLQGPFQNWLNEATKSYAELLRAKSPEERQKAEQQVEKMWKGETSVPILIFLHSSVAAARNPEVEYQLALCSQEEAEQLQARLDLRARAGATPQQSDHERSQGAWRKALENWKQFEEQYPTHPDVAAALRLRGRADSMLGNHKAAIASWKKVAGYSVPELEKLAALYLAQREQKQHGAKDK